jgi:hypothetical protein
MVIKADQLLNRPSKLHRRYGGRLVMQKAQQEKMVGGASVNIVLTKKSIKNVDIIKTNVVKIESFFKGTLALDKKQLDDKKRDASKKRKEKIETKLETKPNAESGKISMPAAPRMGILDFVKNFIGNVLLGYFAIRLVKHLPKIMPIVKFLGNAADFIINTGGELLNGLITFAQKGQEAHDKTRGFIKNLGGENFAKGFDKFIGAIDTALFLTTALAGAMAVEALTGDDGSGIMDMFGKKGAAKAAGSAAKGAGTAAKGAGIGAGAVAGIVAGAGLLASALGEGAFQLRKIATKPIQDAQKAFDNERNPLMKIGRGALLGGMYTLLGPLSAVGVLLDIVGAPFRYAIELLRFPFLSEEDKVKQANNLAKFDARIREDFRKALNMVTLGFAFKEKGSFGNIYGSKGSQTEMMGKMQGGGITRGGKSQRGARRTISKGKYKRVLAPQKPTKTELKTEAFTKDKILKESTEQLDKTKYFGPILAISSKIMNKEEPTQRDYQNVGLGINTLISQGIKENQLKGGLVAAFAGGGLVDPDVLSAIETGGDISNWVAKTFRGEVESNAQKTMRMIREKKEEREKQPSSTTPTPDGFEVGPAGTSGDKLTMARNLMRDLGLTADQAAGIVGNMAAESGVENARVQGSRPGTKGALKVDGKTGYGIVQWTSMGRQQSLADYAKSKGADLSKPLSMNIEYQFFLKEFKGKYGHVLSQIKQARDVKTASTIFMQQYEIPAGYKTEAKIMERYNMSKPIYDKLTKGEGKATEGPGTYIGAPTNMELGTQSGSLSEAKSLAESMKVPLFSHVRPNSTGYHRTGRAMDFSNDGVGNGTPQQLSLANEFVKRYGATAKEIFYTPLGFSIKDGKKVPPIAASGHYNHVHIAFSKGGRVSKPTYALIGEKGPEFVFDADTTAGLDRIAPQLLEKLNIAKTKPQLSGILQSYAPYDAMSQQTIIVPTPSGGGDNSRYNNSSAGGGVAFMPIGGGGDDPFATLYQGG